MKLLWIYLFSFLFICTAHKRVFLKTISYLTKKPVESNVLVYDTFNNKLDSFVVTGEGLFVDLPDKELVLIINATEAGYHRKSVLLSSDNIRDTLSFEIDPRGVSRCYFGIRPIQFDKNSYVIDSADIISLKRFRAYMIKANVGASENLIIDVYVSTDIEERANRNFLQTKRTEAVKDVLMYNNNLKVEFHYGENYAYPNPKNKFEHGQNRNASFKIRNMWSEELEIRVDEK